MFALGAIDMDFVVVGWLAFSLSGHLQGKRVSKVFMQAVKKLIRKN